MSVISGSKCSVDGVTMLQRWQVGRVAATSKYAASNTGAGTGATKGPINVSGSLAGIGGAGIAAVTPGAELAFVGVTNQGPDLTYGGTILITSLSINVDIEGGGPITWAANFGVQGDVTPGAAVAVADNQPVVHDGASDSIGVQVEATPSNHTIANVRNWSLNINAPEKTYVQGGLMYRKPGNLEGDVSIAVYNDTLFNVNYNPNVLAAVRLFIDATTYWRMEWLRFKEQSNFVNDRGTQALVGYTINADWSCAGPIGSGALGHITRPNGTHVFGT